MLDFAVAVVTETARVFYEGSLWILIGFLVAGALHEFLPTDLIARHLGAESPRSVALAALLGAPIPLCSCGVLPAAAALRGKGASRSSLTSFLVATPETGVDSIALTYGLLGPVMAVVRPLVAILTALVAGLLSIFARDPDDASSAPPTPPPASLASSDAQPDPALRARGVRAFRYGFGKLLDEIAFWIVAGVLLTGILSALLPDDFFGARLGWDGGIVPMLAMIVAGVPLYMCASASTPVAAALIAKGLSPGAALVFLLVGPATNAATLAVAGSLLGARRLRIYVGSIIGVSLVSGLLLDAFAGASVRGTALAGPIEEEGAFGLLKLAAAFAFAILLALSFRRTRFREGLRDARERLGGIVPALARLRVRTLVHPAVLGGGVLILLAVLLAESGAVDPESPGAGDDPPLVAVSVLPLAWFVDAIAGERVRVAVMLPPGASPATHSPTLEQLRAVAEAQLYVKVGHPHFPFERAWLDRLLVEEADIPVVDASQGVEQAEGDPHIWVSPRRALPIADAVAAALAELLPEHRTDLEANAGRLRARIDAVDAAVREQLAGKRGARFLVFHPAWGYLADDYGLEQWAIEANGKEPGARRLATLIEDARAAQIDVVFAQPHFHAGSARLVADEIGARVELLDPLAYDWDASLRHAARRIAEAARP